MILILLACSSSPNPEVVAPAPASPAPAASAAPSAWPVALGEPVDASNVVAVDDLVAKASEYNGKPVTMSGVVKEVCQKKGCWHTIATTNPDVTVMVKDKDYAIFLPGDAAGKKVLVKGIFAVEEMPMDEAKHYAEDAGKDPSGITGPVKTFAVDASGVLFI